MTQLLEQDVLADVACQVIETTAFAFAQACAPAEAMLPDVGVLAAEITFQGPVTGALRMATSYEGAATIAGNLLGLDADDVTDEQALQGLHELLNIIAGQWLTRSYGVQVVFQLGIPQTCAEWDSDLAGEVSLLVDDFPLRLHVELR